MSDQPDHSAHKGKVFKIIVGLIGIVLLTGVLYDIVTWNATSFLGRIRTTHAYIPQEPERRSLQIDIPVQKVTPDYPRDIVYSGVKIIAELPCTGCFFRNGLGREYLLRISPSSGRVFLFGFLSSLVYGMEGPLEYEVTDPEIKVRLAVLAKEVPSEVR